ncbi:tautomerase family protein [Pseudodesulfovibrio portus]|uniref:Tautomerase family protein n=1 Tax=Pseudodesulfovibrio portus TaxID=231439 RepID=A0ABN6RW72_9BACT|nr:tautomerase family protein [Pseudodesulfovibrio portus]BDQ33973.1 tautomerase family protein [Pseudodesulfovibrio portus]
MPLTTLTMRTGRDAASKKELLDGVHDALVRAFGIPKNDRYQYINEVGPENWDESRRDGEILVEIKAFAGRSVDAKRALYAHIVDNLSACGVPPEDVFIVVHDLPMENWGIRGGKAACDVDFSFRIDV